jgi:hypothetical protein
MWVFSFNSEGDLTLENHIILNQKQILCLDWHPKAEKDSILIAGKKKNETGGFIAIYNIISKLMNTVNAGEIDSFRILNDGHTILTL